MRVNVDPAIRAASTSARRTHSEASTNERRPGRGPGCSAPKGQKASCSMHKVRTPATAGNGGYRYRSGIDLLRVGTDLVGRGVGTGELVDRRLEGRALAVR